VYEYRDIPIIIVSRWQYLKRSYFPGKNGPSKSLPGEVEPEKIIYPSPIGLWWPSAAVDILSAAWGGYDSKIIDY
jgi:hypothetical protein